MLENLYWYRIVSGESIGIGPTKGVLLISADACIIRDAELMLGGDNYVHAEHHIIAIYHCSFTFMRRLHTNRGCGYSAQNTMQCT